MIIVQVDAFTDTPFCGNPAAVCVLSPAERAPSASWMQKLALEMNLSETAFLVPRDPSTWSLRWFTPAVEVDLCGHATLASAHVLWQEGLLAENVTARFETRSGLLTATKRGAWIALDFPSLPPTESKPDPELLPALGVESARYVGSSRFDSLVEVDDEATLRALRPDFRRLPGGSRGVIVTALARSRPYDFVSRYFAPGAGIDEDPVTGSAHSVLGPFWAERLGRLDLTGYQASKRGGTVGVTVNGDRVELRGQAVSIIRATLREECLPKGDELSTE